MRKKIISLLLCVIAIFSLVGCKKEDKENEVLSNVESVIENSSERVTEIPEPTKTQDDGGGEEFVNDEGEKKEEVKIISILVSSDDYYIDNAPIEFDDIITMIENVEGELIVEIIDNMATHKAYNRLVEKIELMEIPLNEK